MNVPTYSLASVVNDNFLWVAGDAGCQRLLQCDTVTKTCNFKLFQWQRGNSESMKWRAVTHLSLRRALHPHVSTKRTHDHTHSQQYAHLRLQYVLSSVMCSGRIYWNVPQCSVSLVIQSVQVCKKCTTLNAALHAVMTTHPVKRYPCTVMQLLWAVYETFTAIYDPLKGKSRLI